MKLDLHCHSNRSDGVFSPVKVAQMALDFGVEVFCLTDHDTFEGFDDVRQHMPSSVHVLRGLEMSCKYEGRTVHLLIYGVGDGPSMESLESRLTLIQAARRERIGKIVERFSKLGIDLDVDEILSSAHGSPGRPHVARALMARGYVRTVDEAFTRYLRDGGPADVQVERISLDEGLELGRSVNAKMSLAHPHTLKNYGVVDEMYRRLKGDGLEGIEALYGRYSRPEKETWGRLAKQHGLIKTGGSDFHEVTPTFASPGIRLEASDAQPLLEWLGIDAPN